MSVVDQVIVFALVTGWGCIVGFLFDCYRTLRKVWCPKSWGTSLGDTLFWIMVTFFTYLFLMLITWGEVRFYVFLAIGLGLSIYLKLFSRTLRKYLLKLYYFTIKFFSSILKAVIVPLKVLKKTMQVPCRLIKSIVNIFKPPKPPQVPPGT